MTGGYRVEVGDHRTEKFSSIVLSTVASEFRRAVYYRHGTNYDKMWLEVSRALKAHTDVLIMEARSVGQSKKKDESEKETDPFLNCLHANIKEEGGDDPSSAPDLRVL